MRKHYRLLLLLLVFVAATIVAVALIAQNRSKTTPPTQPLTTVPEPTNVAFTTQAKLVKKADDSASINLSIKPVAAEQPISTLSIDATFASSKGKLESSSSSPTINKVFKGNNWRIAFSNLINNPDGTVKLEFSAVYTSPDPFMTSGDLEMVSIPLTGVPENATLTYTINPDPTHSSAYDKSATQLHFASAGYPITITE